MQNQPKSFRIHLDIVKNSLIIALFLLGLGANAQNKQINPNIEWRYIKSQEMTLKDGRWYQYEFPAEKGFDYLFNMNHNTKAAKASIQVFDLQNQKIAEFKTDTSDINAELYFEVSDNGTYKVFFGVNLKDVPDETDVPVVFTLIRREKT
jgi:hypothetical protein